MRPSFRLVFAGAVALVALAATATLATVVSQATTTRLRDEIGGGMAELAAHMSGALDRGIYERLRDIRVAASLDTMRNPETPIEAKRQVLERLRSTYPAYAAIALMSPEGKVVTATVPEMTGADVTKREFYQEGRKGPFVGDVHDALLLAKLLSTGPLDVPRFVDIVSPVTGPDGSLVGVIGAHLFWSWAAEIEQTLREVAEVRHPGVEVMILAKDGTVLLGPPEFQNKPLPIVRPPTARFQAVRWPDGEEYLTAFRRTEGYRDYKGLGWTVVARQEASAAYAPVRQLQYSILFAGAVVALASAALAWFAAGWLLSPLKQIRAYSATLGGGTYADPAPKSRISEIAEISDALTSASTRLSAHDAAQQGMIAELNHRVKNTLAVILSIVGMSGRTYTSVAECTRRLQDRLHAIAAAHDILSDNSWRAVDFRAIILRELARYPNHGASVDLEGPTVETTPQAAVMLALAVHELAHNAGQHGAFAQEGGRLAVKWTTSPTDDPAAIELALVWTETGVPLSGVPGPRGLGSLLLDRAAAIGTGGAVILEYLPDGIQCELRVRLFGSAKADFKLDRRSLPVTGNKASLAS